MPRDALVVITGPSSGSGKSSLALDTIYTEGRRRFVESLSTYARQFLGNRDKPPVDRSKGSGRRSPSRRARRAAIRARPSRPRPRSTTTCACCGRARGTCVARRTASSSPRSTRRASPRDVLKNFGTPAQGLGRRAARSGPVASRATTRRSVRGRTRSTRGGRGVRAPLVDGAEVRLDAKLPKIGAETRVDLVIDRLASRQGVARAPRGGGGSKRRRWRRAASASSSPDGARLEYSTQGACPTCGHRLAHRLDPRHFSFNTHAGACPECDGLGRPAVSCDAAKLLVAHPGLPLVDGALHPKFARYLVKGKGYYEHLLLEVARQHRIASSSPFESLSRRRAALLLHGKGAKALYEVTIEKREHQRRDHRALHRPWPGLCGHIDAWHKKTEDPEWAALLEKVMTTAQRARLATASASRPGGAHATVLGGVRLPEVRAGRSAPRSSGSRALSLSNEAASPKRSNRCVAELISRLALLERVGLGYLTLDRADAHALRR
jgi:excinuclease ABC subunit A